MPIDEQPDSGTRANDEAFTWSALPASLLQKLAEHTGAAKPGVAPDVSLRQRFGSPPGDDFVQQAWPVLRDAWLARRPQPRTAVIAELRSAGLGDADGPMRTSAAQVAYLKSCRNTVRLRRIVLDQFVRGAAAHGPGDTAASADGPAPPAFTPELLARRLIHLGPGERLRLADGSGPVLADFAVLPDGTIEASVVDPDRRGQEVSVVSRDDVAQVAHQAMDRMGALEAPMLTLVDAAGAELPLRGLAVLPLSDQVGQFLSQRLGVPADKLPRDSDGDIPFSVGSATFFVRTFEDPPLVIVFSPLLFDVDPSPALSRTLSMWSGHGLLRFREFDRVVVAEIVLPGEPFIGRHLDIAVGTMTAVLDDADDRLKEMFGGRRAGDDRTKHPPRGGVMAEGGYL